MPIVYIKKDNEEVKTPTQANAKDSGYDVYAYIKNGDEDNKHIITIAPHDCKLISTGLRVSPEDGYDIKLYPRSGLAAKLKITLGNAVGVIDNQYNNEIKIILHNASTRPVTILDGERVAQMLIQRVENITFIERTDALPNENSERGQGLPDVSFR